MRSCITQYVSRIFNFKGLEMSENTKDNACLNVAVIGAGVMGSSHVRDIHTLHNTRLVAVCDILRERADGFAAQFGAEAYYDYRGLLEKPGLDAVVIATPHYDHTPISIDFMKRGVHVMVEKPIAVHAKDARKMIEAYGEAKKSHPGLVFAAMFMCRTYGYYRKIKELIDEGELGKLVRATWIITDWFRPQAYYDNGGWRATWRGEGGGVLLNQCPHNLDLYQWFFGMPQRVTGFATIGKYHNIEVEDEVTGYFEHENGMVGHFITTTGESPGTNHLEIAGERGKLVFEKGKLTFFRNRISTFEFIRTSKAAFDRVENWACEIPYQHHGQGGHRLALENFANAVQNGEPLYAPAVEGIHGLTLGNAIMLSSFRKQPVEMPFEEDAYEAKLQELIRTSRYQKPVQEQVVVDLEKSFHQ
jgi:predicted dehydrogenase